MTATDLNQELAELRSAADAYAARHQFIPDLTWPEGVRIAVNFTCDFDAMLLRRLLNEPPMQLAKGEFGGRVGIWQLVELFDATRRKGDDLHARADQRTIPAGAARGGPEQPRDCRSHVGAPGAERAGARRGSSGQDGCRARNELRAAARPARAAAMVPSCSGNTGISSVGGGPSFPDQLESGRPWLEFSPRPIR